MFFVEVKLKEELMLKSLMPAVVATLPAIAAAHNHSNNDLPSVAENFIGDWMTELERVNRRQAKNPTSPAAPQQVLTPRLTRTELQSVERARRANVARAGPYVHGGAFHP